MYGVNFIRGLVGKSEGKRPLEKCGRRWDNITVVLKTARWGGTWTWLLWLAVRTSVGLLWTRQWTFGLRKMWEISRPVQKLLASRKWIHCTELVGRYLRYLKKRGKKSAGKENEFKTERKGSSTYTNQRASSVRERKTWDVQSCSEHQDQPRKYISLTSLDCLINRLVSGWSLL